MKDLIDERNFREKCARSIVKGYNVHYMTREEMEALGLLSKEAESSAENKKTEKEKVFEADERYSHVPSSQYGTVSVEDPVTKEQIEKILGEQKSDLFESMKELQ